MGKKEELEIVAKKVASCKLCPLYQTATNPVAGNGDFETEIMFIGEAPGYWEDQKGIPFCGAAGKLLDELLVSIGLSREKVFVTNILKHRPPDNRDPSLEEIEACRSLLDEQIMILDPKVIVTLGRFSMGKFLPYARISKDHGVGRVVEFNHQQFLVIPMYHPAAALRGAEVDRQLREDFKKIPLEIEKFNHKEDLPEKEVKEEEKQQLSLI